MSNAANHVHRYKKVNLGQNGKKFLVYKCVKPLCSHYVPLHLAEGKICECNRCGEPMLITKVTLTRSNGGAMQKPHCNTCIRKKKNTEIEAIADFLNNKP